MAYIIAEIGVISIWQYDGRMEWIKEVFFPKKCVNCGKMGSYVCERCEVGLWEAEQICPTCNHPSENGETHIKCRLPLGLDGLIVMWTHQGIARKMIRKIQNRVYFDVMTELVARGMPLLGRQQFGRFTNFSKRKPTIMPVPITKREEKEKGFSAAHKLAGFVARQWGLDYKERVSDLVILVDSVWTKGALMKATCKTLKQEGVKEIWGLVLAR